MNVRLNGKSAQDLEKEFERLSKLHKEYKKKNGELTNSKSEKLSEYIRKEQEYREIIEKLTKKLRPTELYTGADHQIKMEEIRGMHGQIIENISLA